LRAEKLLNEGCYGLGLFLEQEVPAFEQVDFRFRYLATISMGTRHSTSCMGVRMSCQASFATLSVRIGSLQFGRTKWQV
jgi:hypothetical protein